jgi:hypothetical protein
MRGPVQGRTAAGIRHGVNACLFALAVLGSSACFRGAEREKEAPPGLPGGLCLAPQPPQAPEPFCEQGTCDTTQNFCFRPEDPCFGFFCGGSDRGTCVVQETDGARRPACECAPGYDNEPWALYCCPADDDSDPNCEALASGESGEPAQAESSGP